MSTDTELQEELEPLLEDQNGSSKGASDQKKKIRSTYISYLYFNTMLYLSLMVAIFWVTLIEQVIVGVCEAEADCFIFPRAHSLSEQLKVPTPQHVNCSNFELDDDSTLVCYKVGFYLLEAFSITGGLLYILTSSMGIIFPLATRGTTHRYISGALLV